MSCPLCKHCKQVQSEEADSLHEACSQCGHSRMSHMCKYYKCRCKIVGNCHVCKDLEVPCTRFRE